MRYGGARPSYVLGLLWIGVADLVGVARDRAAVAVEAAGGSVVGQVDGPQDAGGALGDRTPAGAVHVGGDPAGAASSWGFPGSVRGPSAVSDRGERRRHLTDNSDLDGAARQ